MKKLFLSTLLFVIPLLANAYDCQVNGIYYNLIPKGNAAEVTYQKYETSYISNYSGSVTIPKSFTYKGVEYSVTGIGDHAFYICRGLTSVTIPNSVTSIGTSTFEFCSGLTSITIPNSVTNIGNYAFKSCSGLTSVTIPNSVTSIEQGVFYGCSGLTSVIIPNSVTSIGFQAFNNCSGLTSVIIPNSVTSIGFQAFNNCTGLTSVTIPNSVSSIGYHAFSGCSGLTSITIPNSVTSIGQQAFKGCTDLTSVTIGSSVRSIGKLAFYGCSKLEDVYCFAENVPSTSTDAFENSYPEYATLYVPAMSLNAYKTTNPWSLFGTFKAIGGTGEEPTKCATPTISYADKQLTFACETEGVEYVSEIKDVDIKKFYDSSINLSATYEISVYATKSGYENSDIATATLVWIEAEFSTNESSGVKLMQTAPVLIQANDGQISVEGAPEGTIVAVYDVNGVEMGAAISRGGNTMVRTHMNKGSVAIVKIGERVVKVLMK